MRNIDRFCAVALSIVATALTAISCKDKSSDSASATSQPSAPHSQIAVIAKSTVDAYWKTVQAGARKPGAEFNVNSIWTAPDTETNHSQHDNMVDDLAIITAVAPDQLRAGVRA